MKKRERTEEQKINVSNGEKGVKGGREAGNRNAINSKKEEKRKDEI